MYRFVTLVVVATLAGSAFAQPATNERIAEAVRLLRDGNDKEQDDAVKLLKELGPQSVPAIPALIEAIKDGPPARRIEIAKVLGSHGTAAKAAIPVLVAIVSEPRVDGNLFQEVVKTVAALGDPGNLEIVRRCMSYESQGRGGRYVSNPAPAYLAQNLAATVPVVADFLTDLDAGTRQRAAISLALLVARPDKDKPSPITTLAPATRERTARALHAAIDDPDIRTRCWAAAALLDVEPTALAKVVPILVAGARLNHSGGSDLRSLARTGAAGARLVVDYLDEPNPQIRHTVMNCLGMFGDDGLPALADGLRDPNPRVREGVLRTLNNTNRTDKLRGHVYARLQDPDASVRLAAAVALVAKDPNRAVATVPVLTAFAFDANSARRWEALMTLRTLGPMARPAIPDLLRRIRFGDGDTRLLAAETLVAADQSTWRSVVPVLIAIVKIDDGRLRTRAINDLRDAGPRAGEALPALRSCFADKDAMVRVQAAEAVFRIDPTTVDEAVACLITVLREPNGGRRPYRQWRAASRALDKIGPAAKAAVPALIEVAQADPEAGVAPDMAAIAIRLDPEHAGAAYDMFRNNLNPGHPDPDDLWLSRMVDLKKLALPLLPELLVALGSKKIEQVVAAFDTLAAIGPDAHEALPTLRAMIKAKKHEARAAALIQVIEKK
jgi:HEAT repeat protein